jgi:hypothetical protein
MRDMRNRPKMRDRSLPLLVMLGAPRVALACPVCFGQNDSPMAQAMNLGILLMLVVVGGVLAGFAAFFISLVRRARLADPVPAPSRVEPQEGTAQC